MTPDELTYLASFFLKPLVGGAAEKAKNFSNITPRGSNLDLEGKCFRVERVPSRHPFLEPNNELDLSRGGQTRGQSSCVVGPLNPHSTTHSLVSRSIDQRLRE